MSSPIVIDGAPAIALFSLTTQQSQVSSRFIQLHFPEKSEMSEFSANVSVSLGPPSFTISTCYVHFLVEPFLNHCDAILGQDWLYMSQQHNRPEITQPQPDQLGEFTICML